MYNTDADILEQDNVHSVKIEDNIHTQIKYMSITGFNKISSSIFNHLLIDL